VSTLEEFDHKGSRIRITAKSERVGASPKNPARWKFDSGVSGRSAENAGRTLNAASCLVFGPHLTFRVASVGLTSVRGIWPRCGNRKATA